MIWKIENHNDTGPSDESFWKWWTISDGTRTFECDDEKDAQWLADLLNASEKPKQA